MENKYLPKQLCDEKFKFCLIKSANKIPFEKEWQNKGYTFDDPKLLEHIEKGGNYGVLCGINNLAVIDIEAGNGEVTKSIENNLPETMVIKSGKGGFHFYYFVNDLDKKIILEKETKHFGEVQFKGQCVVGAGSIHPNGNRYEVEHNANIANISKKQLDNAIEIFYDVREEDNKNNKQIGELTTEIASKVNFKQLLKDYGLQEKNGNYNCPFHKSEGGICLSVDNKGIYNCFHCGRKGNIISFVAELEGITIKDAVNKLQKDFGVVKVDLENENNKTNKTDKEEILNEFLKLTTGDTKKWAQATELLVEYILKNNHIYTTKNDLRTETWIYKDGIYIPEGKSEIKEILREILKKWYTVYVFNLVLNKIEPDTYIEEKKFFEKEQKNIDEIPVLNGILNIKTRELSPFTSNKIFFNKINAVYNLEAKCSRIKTFLSEILKKSKDTTEIENNNVVFELFGYTLYKDYIFLQTAIMLYGNGENGKGVLLNLLREFLRNENCSSIPLNNLTSDGFSSSELFGKLANICGDISDMPLKDSSRFKELTSGTDQTEGKRKFLRSLFFVNYAKLIFSCNELPRVYDMSKGFWRRWIVLEFPHSFIKKKDYDLLTEKEQETTKLADPDLIHKLTSEEEMSGLLNEALNGLDRLFKNKQFSYSKSIEDVKDFWIRKSDSFTAFCFDYLEEDENENTISKRELRTKFSKYCKKHKVKGTSEKSINFTLTNLFGSTSLFPNSYGNVHEEYAWTGIKWRKNTNL